MNKTSFNRSIWLLNTIYQSGTEGITFEEICSQWAKSGMSHGKDYPLRSFHNHRKEIEKTFNVPILCKKSTNSYYIRPNSQRTQLVSKLLGLISLSQVLENDNKTLPFISVNVQAGGEGFITVITNAIQEKRLIKVDFFPIKDLKSVTYDSFQPMGIKNYKGCWYLLGADSNQEFHLLNLQQVASISLLEETFEPVENATLRELLVENYGSRLEKIPTLEITFKAPSLLADQLLRNPIHVSQRQIEKKNSYSIFYLNVKPTLDFIRDWMTLGASVEILTPEILKDAIVVEAKKISRKNS